WPSFQFYQVWVFNQNDFHTRVSFAFIVKRFRVLVRRYRCCCRQRAVAWPSIRRRRPSRLDPSLRNVSPAELIELDDALRLHLAL
ncbi:hypothetical protein ABLN64_10065, partial [Mycobacterium tuberculosis]